MVIVDLNEALDIADKVSDRNLSWAEHPSMINMIYAMEILARECHALDNKMEEWQTRAENMRDDFETANGKLDRVQSQLTGLKEFIRSALNLDAHALDDLGEARKILGSVFADARLWARVKDMVGGKFVAGDVVTADAVNAFSEAVKTSRKTGVNPLGSAADDKHWKGFTTRVQHNGVWLAPAGTDPADTDKWTWIGTSAGTPKLDILMGRDVMAVFNGPDRQHFSIGSPEPAARVQKVKRPQGDITFIRFGRLSDGKSLWRRVGDDSKTYLTWSEVVRYQAAVEVPE